MNSAPPWWEGEETNTKWLVIITHATTQVTIRSIPYLHKRLGGRRMLFIQYSSSFNIDRLTSAILLHYKQLMNVITKQDDWSFSVLRHDRDLKIDRRCYTGRELCYPVGISRRCFRFSQCLNASKKKLSREL